MCICPTVIRDIADPVITSIINDDMGRKICGESCTKNYQNYILPLLWKYDNYLEKNSKKICNYLK